MSHEERLKTITRRHFFCRCGTGIGVMALASLLREGDICAAEAAAPPVDPLAPKPPPFAPKAKQIIYLFMAGAPSQLSDERSA